MEDIQTKIQFAKNVLISGTIVCKTGLHVGGSKEELEIGGMENIVIIDPRSGQPIIPGSSLKGKLRSLLELRDGSYSSNGSPHNHKKDEECKVPDCKLCTIFGSSADMKRGPTRLIVRDSFIKNKEKVELEIKTENVINRLTGKAEHPRSQERVPAGSEFNVDMVYSIYNKTDADNLSLIFALMNKLQDSYLGGSGSRGYGKIEFNNIGFWVKTTTDYIEGTGGITIKVNGKDRFVLSEILQQFEKIKTEISR